MISSQHLVLGLVFVVILGAAWQYNLLPGATILPPYTGQSCGCNNEGLLSCTYSFSYSTSPDWTYGIRFDSAVGLPCYGVDSYFGNRDVASIQADIKAEWTGNTANPPFEYRYWYFYSSSQGYPDYNSGPVVEINNPWYSGYPTTAQYNGQVIFRPTYMEEPTPTITPDQPAPPQSTTLWGYMSQALSSLVNWIRGLFAWW